MLVYNPYSGDRKFKDALDACAEIFFEAGYLTDLVRGTSPEALTAAIETAEYAAMAIAGGDGTVNLVLNTLNPRTHNLPIGIIPAGTANDFASHIKMPKNPYDAAQALINGRMINADLGNANGRYFINSCGAGLFINVSHEVTADNPIVKSLFGKLAYYVKGARQIPNIKPLPLRISTPTHTWEEEFMLVLTTNTGGSGGFENLTPGATIEDGKLDFVAFRAMNTIDIAATLLKVITGGHVNDPKVIILREENIQITHLSDDDIDTDADGEIGPKMPLNITCEKAGMKLIVPPAYPNFPKKGRSL